MEIYLQAIATVLEPFNIMVVALGVIAGVVLGALPGLSSTLGLALLIPVTFGLDPVPAFLLLGGMYSGSIYGGSITAILINVPGTPSSAATCLDGYPLTRQGRAGEALGMAVLASFFGGILSTFVLLFLAPPLARIGLMFGPPEQFWIAIFGLTVIVSIAGRSFIKGLMSGAFGVFLSTVGIDLMYGHPRFTFGSADLYEGIPLVPAIVGMFTIPVVIENASRLFSLPFDPASARIRNILPSFGRLRGMSWLFVRSSIIGTAVGIIPGAGTPVATFLAYDRARRSSPTPERFGNGELEGVAAPETANNAVESGTLVPLLTLGIPGNAVAAVYLGAMMIHGLDPGPTLFTDYGAIVYAIIMGLFLANIIMLVAGLGLIKLSINILRVPSYLLTPFIFIFAVIGSYAIRNNFFDVGLMLWLGFVGYWMVRNGFSVVAVVLGMILGPIAENAWFQCLVLFDGDMLQFAGRPICVVLIAMTLASAVVGSVREHRNRRKAAGVAAQTPEEGKAALSKAHGG